MSFLKEKVIGFFVLSLILAGSFLFGLTPVYAGTVVHIDRDGKSIIDGAKIVQIAGTSFFARLVWGDAYVRFILKTTDQTKVFRGTNEPTVLSEIKAGDTVYLEGELEPGGDALSFVATKIRDDSIQKKQSDFSGTVSSIDPGNSSFTLKTKKYGSVVVKTSGQTKFLKGSRIINLAHLNGGDNILSASGDFDIKTNTLSSTKVVIYINQNLFKSQNFEGVLKDLSSVSSNQIKVSIGATLYTVFFSDKTILSNKNKESIVLNRFVLGDKLKIFGTRREVDDYVIDAEIIRNQNL